MAEKEKRLGGIFGFIKWIVIAVIAVLLFAGGFALGTNWANRDTPRITPATVEAQIAQISDLATAELQYNGVVYFEEGQIPLITKKSFTMTYAADARAGVDLSQATVKVTDTRVEVTIPQATVQSIAIDSDSLNFYDSKRALFNWQNREDTAQALAAAEEDVKTKIDQSALIERANEQAINAVTTLLAPLEEAYPGTKVVVTLTPPEKSEG